MHADQDITIGSLFSGIGGLELGIERAIEGSRTVFQVESDPYARRVLAKNWPHAQRFENVEKVSAENLPRCTILCGGFPCSDVSIAGKQAGIDGTRSGLWSEFARIAGDLRPRIVVVENVAALRFRGLGRVLGDLAALGYGAVWDCIPAAAIGARHYRDRLFVVAYSDHDPRPTMRRQCQAVAGDDQSGRNHVGRSAGDAGGGRSVQGARDDQSRFEQHLRTFDAWSNPSGMDRLVDGVPFRLDRLRCLGNAVVPQVAEVIGHVAKSFLVE